MGDDSERTPDAEADAGASDDGCPGTGDPDSDSLADGSPDDSTDAVADETPEDASGTDAPTEADAAGTVDRLRTDEDPNQAALTPGGADNADSESQSSDGGESDSDDADNSDPDSDDIDSDDADNSDPDSDDIDSDDAGNSDPGSDDVDSDDDADAAASTDGDDEIWPDDDSPPADAAEVTGDGGTPATVGDAPEGAGSADPLIDDGIAEGPESDEEMPLAAHIEEMIHRLAVVLGVGGIITLLLYPGADLVNSAFGLELVSSTQVIDFLWNTHVPGAPELTDRRPRVYGPLELLLTELKVAALGGLLVGLPVFVYETYLFMRPGLYPTERRYYLAAVPTSLVLAVVGVSFAHFLVLPAIFAYFTSYTTGTAVVAFGLKETFNLILILMGYNAVIFQIPLFIMLAIMMNLVTRAWLEARRLLFWGAFLGIAFLVSPDPTGMAPIIIAATMIALFEGTLLGLRWTASGAFVVTADRLAARRPHAVAVAALVGYLLSPLPVPGGYYDLLPTVAVDALAANGLAAYTPAIIAGSLVGAFEVVALALRRYGRSERALRIRLGLDTARRPVWLVAAVVGYLGSPDPVALGMAAGVSLPPAVAGGVAVGLVVGYEALRALLARRENRAE